MSNVDQWPTHYDPKVVEQKWQNLWLTREFYERVFRFKEDSDKPSFVIDTPPPFTSGELHMGHAYWVTIIDTTARFRRLAGYNVLHPQGWDTQGLPTELKVQYKLGVPKEKRELFLQKCREWTEEMISKMKEGMVRLGYRPEWERFEYRTYESNYRRAVQRSLLEMFGKGLLKNKEGPVYWCPKCETALAQSEVGYKEEEGVLAYVKFPLEGGGNITIATTRPELIPAVQAIVVHPSDPRYTNVVGRTAIAPIFNRKVKVIADEAVDKDFGTGAVMVCSFGDPQDIRWILKYGLGITQVVDDKGRMINTGQLDGMRVRDAKKKMLELLKGGNYLERTEQIRHNVISHTERSDCGAPVEFLIKEQIYVEVLPYKQLLLEKIKEMNFKPARMAYYLEEWIKGLEWDWNISRQRLYGTPIPFWRCERGHLVPAREEDLPVDPAKDSPPVELCPTCGAKLRPITDVADVWVDSSITALFIAGYFDNPKRFSKTFPTSLREQGTDIIRTWLFYSFFRSIVLTGKIPFQDVLVNGQVLGPDGTRMSKSKGNTVSPLDRIDEYGADPLRLTLLETAIGDDFPFKWEKVKTYRLFLQKLWNAARLASTAPKVNERPIQLHLIDRWILNEHKSMVKRVVEAYNEYNYNLVVKEIYHFFWEILADEYLELIKYRLSSGDPSCSYTLLRILRDVLVLLHPVAPHVTEEIYSRLYSEEISVMLLGLPRVEDIEDDKESLEIGRNLTKATSAIRTAKIRNRLAMNAPVKVKLLGSKEFLNKIDPVMEDLTKTLRITELLREEAPEIGAEIVN
ncbi:valine--tRNA ligase [Sulfodiicoccus acidiphilus]|uniref:Valine--tRNA ligase n=1 Tax=Sulfodiicoccus acidiphilus TaxID=1670455 RepID=A0A830H0P2_9CREN|nr:valine--tRNA ligase [Sulfodiicoccus acidiphilus]GGT95370.1 valine--tRNA ligase [Sulfodiicoccus acidiphilus]